MFRDHFPSPYITGVLTRSSRDLKVYPISSYSVSYTHLADDDEIVRRIGDADGVLVSYTSRIGREVLERCPQVRYVGMCCSLYSEASANVDIAYARGSSRHMGRS